MVVAIDVAAVTATDAQNHGLIIFAIANKSHSR